MENISVKNPTEMPHAPGPSSSVYLAMMTQEHKTQLQDVVSMNQDIGFWILMIN